MQADARPIMAMRFMTTDHAVQGIKWLIGLNGGLRVAGWWLDTYRGIEQHAAAYQEGEEPSYRVYPSPMPYLFQDYPVLGYYVERAHYGLTSYTLARVALAGVGLYEGHQLLQKGHVWPLLLAKLGVAADMWAAYGEMSLWYAEQQAKEMFKALTHISEHFDDLRATRLEKVAPLPMLQALQPMLEESPVLQQLDRAMHEVDPVYAAGSTQPLSYLPWLFHGVYGPDAVIDLLKTIYGLAYLSTPPGGAVSKAFGAFIGTSFLQLGYATIYTPAFAMGMFQMANRAIGLHQQVTHLQARSESQPQFFEQSFGLVPYMANLTVPDHLGGLRVLELKLALLHTLQDHATEMWNRQDWHGNDRWVEHVLCQQVERLYESNQAQKQLSFVTHLLRDNTPIADEYAMEVDRLIHNLRGTIEPMRSYLTLLGSAMEPTLELVKEDLMRLFPETFHAFQHECTDMATSAMAPMFDPDLASWLRDLTHKLAVESRLVTARAEQADWSEALEQAWQACQTSGDGLPA